MFCAAHDHGLDVEPLSAPAIERRWPGLRVGGDLIGVYEPTAGYLLVEDCVESHVAAAVAAGAELMIEQVARAGDTPAWSANEHEVTVRLLHGRSIKANHLIIAAGPWAGKLLADLSLRLTVLRKSLFWFKADTPEYDAASGTPVFLFELSNGIFYGFPKLDPLGVKVAEHTGGQAVATPDAVDRTPNMDEQARLTQFLSAHLPGVRKEVSRHEVCLYTMSPDEHFIVDRHPAHPNVLFAAGLSGHGFKFTSVLGRTLADLALDGGTSLPIDFLSLSRFANVRAPRPSEQT